MSNNNNTKSAAYTNKAGYSQTISDLAETWLDYCANPDCCQARDHLAVNLDKLFQSRIPIGHYDGILMGCEEDVRQEACLLAINKYLAGNPPSCSPPIRGGSRRSPAGELRAPRTAENPLGASV